MAKTSKLTFLTKSLDPIRRSSTDNILLGGDLNCPLTEVEKVDGRDKLHKKKDHLNNQELCNSFDFVDVWRTQHLNKRRYSWANGSGKIRAIYTRKNKTRLK